jgi:hypothetical protein
MLRRAGFDNFHPIDLGRPLSTTSPDFYFPDTDAPSVGVCIYFNGLSKHTRKKNLAVR